VDDLKDLKLNICDWLKLAFLTWGQRWNIRHRKFGKGKYLIVLIAVVIRNMARVASLRLFERKVCLEIELHCAEQPTSLNAAKGLFTQTMKICVALCCTTPCDQS
jgi:hypothetical protein